MDRIGRLQTAVESLQEELRTEGHSAITAVTSVRNVRVEYDNLYDVVRSMQRQQNFLTDQVDEPRRRGEPKL
jgi:3'-phosphoadenosine 5'-phosphosulfate sulfotransferase